MGMRAAKKSGPTSLPTAGVAAAAISTALENELLQLSFCLAILRATRSVSGKSFLSDTEDMIHSGALLRVLFTVHDRHAVLMPTRDPTSVSPPRPHRLHDLMLGRPYAVTSMMAMDYHVSSARCRCRRAGLPIP